jgi:hypothetical protein
MRFQLSRRNNPKLCYKFETEKLNKRINNSPMKSLNFQFLILTGSLWQGDDIYADSN